MDAVDMVRGVFGVSAVALTLAWWEREAMRDAVREDFLDRARESAGLCEDLSEAEPETTTTSAVQAEAVGPAHEAPADRNRVLSTYED